ncbi:MAG: response regulator [Lachnospiraceae bacterium]|nr:response regulator [Lachnospiraceae bacterium]
MSNPGHLTILEPYTDVQSGNTMMALGTTLSDGVSVISVDVSLERMQQMTEEAVKKGGSDIEMVLTPEGMVVSHSDVTQVGRTYLPEMDTLGGTIVRELKEADDRFFEFDYLGIHYIVYDAPFAGSWHCISVHNATSVFRSLNRILAITVFVVIAVALTIGIMLGISNKRYIIAHQAVASNEAKSAFLSNMSHEIRTPINAMLGMNEMILRESNDRDVLAYAENVKTAGNTLLTIVNDILDFSKIEAGKMELMIAPYDLASLLNDLINMVRPRADEKSLKLELAFDPETPKRLQGDVMRIRQATLNLLTNAIKYTERGTITFRVGYSCVRGESDSILLNVSVEDTGIGIRQEDMEKLFSEFVRLEEKRNRNIEGTGLGMNITRGLLEMMGSTLQVESEYGMGSKFYFSLKQTSLGPEALGDFQASYNAALEKHVVYRESFRAPDARLLVIDDNPMNLVVFESLLKQTEMQIDTAVTGDEGLALAAVNHYDIIFFDHMMPNKDGIETLHELRQMGPNPNSGTPAVCLTANAISGAKQQYLAEGFDDYLSKPIDADILERMILSYLDERKVEKLILEKNPLDQSMEDVPELLKDLEEKSQGVIDVRAGIRNSGSVGAYLPLLRIFAKSIGERSKELDWYFKTGDLADYTIKVHALKSSARIIGAEAFGEKAQALESAGKSGDVDYLQQHHAAFLREYGTFDELLGGLFAEEKGSADRPVADPALMKEVFGELLAAAEEMDCNKLQAIFEEMHAYNIPEGDAILWEKLRESSDGYDYDMIVTLLSGKV